MTHAKRYYEQRFRKELARLNAGQRQAVMHLDGPMLVIAGPGTGKTHVLSARIGRILMETDTRANEILCLTFTDAAVRAMRRRLVELIGPEGYRVEVYTFHSFCNSVIRRHMELFPGHRLEPVSELEEVEIVRALLDALPPDNPLRHGRDPRRAVEQIRQLFRDMKAEHWTVEAVCAQIDDWLAALPQHPDFRYKRRTGKHQPGDPKQDKIERERQRMEALRQAALLFPAYEEAMRERGRYDYHDMILWVLDAFRQNEWLLRDYQEQYQYILVDEYQDTNSSQNELVRLLASYWDAPNLFIVGDDDQSIYEFQGARLHNLMELYDAWRDHMQVVVLTENYRSSQPILDAARNLIAHNRLRLIHELAHLGVRKELVAAGPAASSNLRPRLIELPDPWAEARFAERQIKEWLDEGCPPSRIAVIYARHSQVQRLADLLQHSDIPHELRRTANALDSRSVHLLRTMLEWIWRVQRQPESGERLLFELLHAPCWHLPPEDLFLLARWRTRPEQGAPLWYELLSPERLAAIEGLRAPDRLAHAARVLREAEQQALLTALPRLVERLVNQSGLLAWVLSDAAEPGERDALWSFVEFIKDETARRPRLHLEALLQMLRHMDTYRLAIPVQQPAATGEAVTLVTAHSAKGLEFERVIVLGCQQDPWENESAVRGAFKLPPGLTRSGEADYLEARRRLFYVAITRARTHLVCCWSATDERGKPARPTRFVYEMEGDEPLVVEQPTFAPEEMVELQRRLMAPADQPSVAVPDEAWLRARVQELPPLSISAINQFLKCPLGFYYRYILGLPSVPGIEERWGLAMHEALRRYFEEFRLSANETWPPATQLAAWFEAEMERLRGWFTPDEWQFYTQQGSHYLTAWLDLRCDSLPQRFLVERTIHGAIGEVAVTGTIDRIDLLGQGQARVVDYKLTQRNAWTNIHPPSGKNEFGTPLWRQLVFYQLLLEQDRRLGLRSEKAMLDFLTPDDKGVFPQAGHATTDEEKEQMRQIVRHVHARIHALDFLTGCGEPDCPWCHHARMRAADSLSDPELEMLL